MLKWIMTTSDGLMLEFVGKTEENHNRPQREQQAPK
jgi:hypothetical protein